ncbi:MAG: DUF4983 domain-containing protein [Aureispira sp.]|nr:DUF4983 domain-containing protein [Aureispira sp.]
MKKLIVLICCFCTVIVHAQKAKKLLLIGIDGCRGDALIVANTPNLDSLMSTGLYTTHARTITPTYSASGWSSMLTGVWNTKHRVINNLFIPNDVEHYPHFFNYIEEHNTALNTVSISQWAPINSKIIDKVDYKVSPKSGAAVAEEAIQQLQKDDLDAMFLHFDDVDHAGHISGFSPYNSRYIYKIEKVDSLIGRVLKQLRDRPNLNQEDWLVMVSTDHGGINISHGGPTTIERTTFLILNGSNLPKLGSMQPNKKTIKNKPYLTFDGKDDYVVIPAHKNYNFDDKDGFTIECRVCSNGWEGSPAVLANKGRDAGKKKGFVLAAHNNGKIWKFNLGDGNSRVDILGDTINDGKWHHLAVSVKYSGSLRMYQDGQLIDVKHLNKLSNFSNKNPIVLAQDITEQYKSFFKGNIDELRVWNTALTDSILAQWSCQDIDKTHPSYSNLIGYWKLKSSNQKLLIDHAFNKHHGKLKNKLGRTKETVEYSDYSHFPEMVDIVPTALDHLGIPLNTVWQLDGHSLFGREYSKKKITKNQFEISNMKGKIRLHFPKELDENIQVYLINSDGVRLYSEKVLVRKLRMATLNKDFSFLKKPTFIHVKTKQGVLRAKWLE